ncbi:MAG: hypothetical protein NZM25_04480 [Leptospiraceae bacterium]|nr:hypothetical protein [Leptospiraceae bacterium]MDW8305731.1 hypothetical protein [Leptospiraceae bacterium]
MQRLIVLHGPKEHVTGFPSQENHFSEVFYLETCQRFLVVAVEKEKRKAKPWIELPWEVYEDEEAYAFLLEFLCGLKSALIGETEVLGQFRRAYESQKSHLFILRNYFENLIADAREVRHNYLQNLGNLGYGSLVRRALIQEEAQKGVYTKPTLLLLGAGELALAVAPYLCDFAKQREGKLYAYNRTAARLAALQGYLEKLGKDGLEPIDTEDLGQMVQKSNIVVVAIPYDRAFAERLTANFLQNKNPRKILIRLSGEEEPNSAYEQINPQETLSLKDLFSLKSRSEKLREEKLQQARNFCHIRAKLRFLGSGHSHSWEDLAYFNFALS